MKIKTLIIACLGVLMACSAHADFYVSGGFGWAENTGSTTVKGVVKGDYNSSRVYSGAVGYKLPFIDIVRIEGEYFHNRTKVKKGLGYVNINTAMANGYVTIPSFIPLISPYVGAGIGYGRLEKDDIMPMQFMLGLDADIFAIPVVGSLEYRYLQSNRAAKKGDEKNKYYSHMIMAKIRYEF